MARIWTVVQVAILAGIWPMLMAAQQKLEKPTNPVQIELTMEVATTTEDGLPAILRFTLKNVGGVAADLPMPAMECDGSNGSIKVKAIAHIAVADGIGTGRGCMSETTDLPPLLKRIKLGWIHLLPGEYLVFSGDRRTLMDHVNGVVTYEYWAEYEPPYLLKQEREEATQNGYMVPADKVVSNRMSYLQR